MLANLAAKVGPEFLGQVANHIQQHGGAPDVDRVAQRALALWIIRVRNTRGDGTARNLGVIDLQRPTVCLRDEGAAHRIHRATPLAAFTQPEIAGVLMKNCGIDALGHVVSHDKIRKRCTEIFPITRRALPE